LLGLTPLIVKALVFDRRRMLGLALLAGKLAWAAMFIIVCWHWSRGETHPVRLGSALLAGVTTPFVVLVLRAVGAAMEQKNHHGRGGGLKNSASREKIGHTPRWSQNHEPD